MIIRREDVIGDVYGDTVSQLVVSGSADAYGAYRAGKKLLGEPLCYAGDENELNPAELYFGFLRFNAT